MKKGFAKEASLLTISQVFTAITSMLAVMLLSRFRSLQEYGTYSQIMLIVSLSVSMVQLGIPNSINYFIVKCKNENEKNEFYSTYYSISTLFSIGTGLILILFLPIWIKYFNNYELKTYWWMLLLLPWTTSIINSISYLFIVSEKIYGLVFYNIFSTAANLVIIVLIKMCSGTFSDYLLAYMLLQVGLMGYVYFNVLKITNKTFHFYLNRKLLAEIYRYAIPLGFSSILATISVEIDKIMIGGFLGTEALAIYTNTGKELPVVILISSITAVLTPKIVFLINNKKTESAVKLWKSSAMIGFAIMAFFSTAFIVFAPQLVKLLYGEKYLNGVTIFRIYSCMLLCRFTYFGMILTALGKTKMIMYTNIICIISNFILNFVLYKAFGIIGPAIATVSTTFLAAVLQLFFTAKNIGSSFMQIMPWLDFLLIIAINLALGGLAYWYISAFHIKTGVSDILLCGGLGIIWFGIYSLLLGKKVISTYKLSVRE